MIEKLFNKISIAFAIIGGVIANFLGGMDVLLYAIITLVVLDYITGILKAITLKKLSSEIGFNGFIKKIMLFIIIAAAVIIQKVLDNNIALREITIMFFIANEGISLLENVSEFIPIPKKIKDVLLQLRGDES